MPAPPQAAGPAPSAVTPLLSAAAVVRIEAEALQALAGRLEGDMHATFDTVTALLSQAIEERRRIVLTGVGKSGLIAQKIAATLRSTGTPAHFLHPTEALHGDLGMMSAGDVVLLLSASGETPELVGLLPLLARLRLRLLALCGQPASTLARAAEHTLDVSVACEACPHNLAPTASTTVMLALGDALALAVSQRRGFAPEDFASLHPGGQLGRRLLRVRDLMHTGQALPVIAAEARMPEAIYEMSRKKLGLTTVVGEANRLLGLISDGDLRRLLEREGPRALERTAAEVMNPAPHTIAAESFASAALAQLEVSKITALLVTGDAGEITGVLHLHDLWGLHLL